MVLVTATIFGWAGLRTPGTGGPEGPDRLRGGRRDLGGALGLVDTSSAPANWQGTESGGLCVGKRALDAFSISTQITAAWPLLGFLIKGVWMLWLTGPASHGPGKGDTAAPTRASRT